MDKLGHFNILYYLCRMEELVKGDIIIAWDFSKSVTENTDNVKFLYKYTDENGYMIGMYINTSTDDSRDEPWEFGTYRKLCNALYES